MLVRPTLDQLSLINALHLIALIKSNYTEFAVPVVMYQYFYTTMTL